MSRDHNVACAFHNGLTLILRQGSALEAQGDCLVNAANDLMNHGGGVALEIAQQAGSQLSAECSEWVSNMGEIKAGNVAVTGSYNLNKFQKIIHAVGPKQDTSEGRNMLVSTLVNSMKYAELNKCTSLSIPALSVGIFGFPKESSAERHYEAFIIFAGYFKRIQYLKTIIINVFTDEEAEIFADKLIDFSDNFQCFQFIGTVKQLGISLNHYYCKTCQAVYDAGCFELTHCCRSCCDFCMSKLSSANCFACGAMANNQYWKCIKCRNAYNREHGMMNCPNDGLVYESKFKLEFNNYRK
jgi:O-acetyl-ADP-ribose deacetylase (regulator of RNase III)